MCRCGVDVDTVQVDVMNAGRSGAGISHIVAGREEEDDLEVMGASQSPEPPYSSWKEVVLSRAFGARHTPLKDELTCSFVCLGKEITE